MKLFLIVMGAFAICMVLMAVGIIIRNKGFATCGRAAASALDGEGGICSMCGSGTSECKKKEVEKVTSSR